MNGDRTTKIQAFKPSLQFRLAEPGQPAYPRPVNLPPLTDLSWAYQLHYYVCFRTYRRYESFRGSERSDFIAATLSEICSRHNFTLIRQKAYPNHVRLLLSLRPEQAVAKCVQTIKTNSASEFTSRFAGRPPLWAHGYLARTVGRVRIEAVRRYLTSQAEHHGYASRVLPPVLRYRASPPIELTAPHASFDLNYHLVFSTKFRVGIFSSEIGRALATYWLRVAQKHGFAIDQMSFLPDHVHLLVRVTPSATIEQTALALLNNGQYFVGRNFPGAMIEAGVERLWRQSAYAGTCGKVSTALLKAFLSRDD